MKGLDYGKDYRYAHDEADGVARGMECLPPAQAGRRFYEPTERGMEARIKQRLDQKIREEHLPEHLLAERQDEREPVVALHPADRDADEIPFAVQHAST